MLKVGDKVKLPKYSKQLEKSYGLVPGWNRHMTAQCGAEGIVTLIRGDRISVRVDDFEDAWSWMIRDLRPSKRRLVVR